MSKKEWKVIKVDVKSQDHTIPGYKYELHTILEQKLNELSTDNYDVFKIISSSEKYIIIAHK